MLIQKNDTTSLKNFVFPKSFMLDPDETCKATALLYAEGLSLIGADNSSYLDFDQPIIKSYIVDNITDVEALYLVGTTVTTDQAKIAERLDIVVLDASTNAFLTSPTEHVKIFLNLYDASDVMSAPFGYLMSSMLEFCQVRKWLFSLYIKNQTGSPIKALVQVSKHNYEDTNYEPPVVIQVAHN